MAAYQVQVGVIGAGVVGLAVARALAVRGKEVLILDRHSAIGSETSSRNSEVIHAGLYYPSSSKKAKFCVTGRHMLYEYCRSRDIPHKQCGKLLVATNEEQLNTRIQAIKKQAIKNGVSDVQVISKEDVKAMEPDVLCHGALWSPSTGVLDSHSYMMSLLADIENHDGILSLNSNVEDAKIGDDGVEILVDGAWVACKTLINCAGLRAHMVASMIHGEQEDTAALWHAPKQYFAKGNYYRLEGRKPPFNHLVYPVPEPGGLGVHATLDWSGLTCKFGPDVQWIDANEVQNPDEIDLDVDPTRAERFYSEVRKYWPELQDNALVPDYAGIRPKLQHPSVPILDGEDSNKKSPFIDFLIRGPKDHGANGLFHLFGIESPGLTSSVAIAESIAQEVDV